MRYRPGRSLPPYAFLPGRDPHPTRDPAGHSFGQHDAPPPFFSAERWRECDPYLWGADLYNEGFLWEAHEAWESLWHVAKPRDATQASFLQGLIQTAAAWLKIPMGQPAGVERLSKLALEKLEHVARTAGSPYMGLDIERFAARVRAFAASAPASIDGRPRVELTAT